MKTSRYSVSALLSALILSACSGNHRHPNIRITEAPFPTGYYNGVVGRVATLNVHYILSYSRQGNTTQEKIDSQIATLDQIKLTRLRAMIEVLLPPFNEVQVTQLVTGLQHREEIWGWYLIDEPDYHNVPPSDVLAAYKAVKAADPRRRPVAIAFTPTMDVAAYKDGMDIYMADPYPISGAHAEFKSPSLKDYYAQLFRLKNYARDVLGKPFWAVLQAHRLNKPACAATDPQYPLCGFPTLAEERYMIYTAIQAGADGLFFYDNNNDEDESSLEARWAEERLRPLLAEFQKYEHSFTDGPIGSVLTESAIDANWVIARLYPAVPVTDEESYVLLLVNHSPAERLETLVTFKEPQIFASATIVNSADNPLPPLTNGRFSVELGPYEVRIYTFALKR